MDKRAVQAIYQSRRTGEDWGDYCREDYVSERDTKANLAMLSRRHPDGEFRCRLEDWNFPRDDSLHHKVITL